MILIRNKYPFYYTLRFFHYSFTSASILALHRLNVLTVISQSFLPFGSTPFLLQPYFNPADSLLFSILPGTTHFSPQKGDGGWSVALFRLSYIFPSDVIAAGNARVLERGREGLHIDRKHEFPPSGTVRAECQSNDLHSIPGKLSDRFPRPIPICVPSQFSRVHLHVRGRVTLNT